MSRASKTVAQNTSGGGLSLDSTFTWNCQTKSWVWSPTKDTTAYAKDIRAVVVRSDLFKIGGTIKGYNEGSFGSRYGFRKKQNGLHVNTWFKPKSGQLKNLGKVNWWDVREKPDFEKSTYNNIIAVKMISYTIVEDGKERKAGDNDPKFVGLRIKGHSWKMVQESVVAFKAELIANGKSEDASQVSPDELETCFIAYLSNNLTENTSNFGNTNTYPVPKFSLLEGKQAALEQEALAMYYSFNDEIDAYLAGSGVGPIEEDGGDDGIETPAYTTPPPPPTGPTENDDLPF